MTDVNNKTLSNILKKLDNTTFSKNSTADREGKTGNDSSAMSHHVHMTKHDLQRLYIN